MAQVVGVPNREPCHQCGNPVFFAERLPVGRHLYHRTCLKCARCGSQLALGSFYETETDGEFCCETCPDEEKNSLLNNNNNDDIATSADAARQSFSEKLARFQTNGSGGLLQKSMSDEEKSKSLKRLSELYSASDQRRLTTNVDPSNTCTYNDKLNGLHEACKQDENPIESSQSDESDDSESDDFEPPALPASQPPIDEPTDVERRKPQLPSKANVLSKLNAEKLRQSMLSNSSQIDSLPLTNDDEQPKYEINNSESTSTPEKSIDRIVPNSNDIHLPLNTSNNLANVTKENDEIDGFAADDNVDRLKSDGSDRSDNVGNQESCLENAVTIEDGRRPSEDEQSASEMKKENEQTNTTTREDERRTNDSNSENEENTPRASATLDQHLSDNDCSTNKAIATMDDKQNTANLNDADDMIQYRNNSCNRNDMVRSRLTQFEALVNSHQSTAASVSLRFNRSSLDVESRTKPMEQNALIEINKKAAANCTADNVNANETSNQSANGENYQVNCNNGDANDADSSIFSPNGTSIENEVIAEKPTPLKRITVNACSPNNESDTMESLPLPPTPSKRRTRTPTPNTTESHSNQDEQINGDTMMDENVNGAEKDNDDNYASTSTSTVATMHKKSDKIYPVGLNPFGSDDDDDDDEDEIQQDQRDADGAAASRIKTDNLNPFDSSDDEVELLKQPTATTSMKHTTKAR